MEGIWYMAVYKDKNKSTWYVSKRYTDWDGSKRDCLSVDFRQKEKLLNMNYLLYRKYRIIRKCFLRISSLFTMKIWKSECVRIQ